MQGCEGLAEFTVTGGMYEETYHGTWEAPEIVSYVFFLGEHVRSTLTGKAYAPRWRMSP